MAKTHLDSRDVSLLAKAYFEGVHASDSSSIDAEPEAQLTVPVSNLFCGLAALAGMPAMKMIRETRKGSIRPDFSVLGGRKFRGWVELKAPDVAVDGELWKGRNQKQWKELSKLDALIVCNGERARLYEAGIATSSDALLPYDDFEAWNPQPLLDLLVKFYEAEPAFITSVSELARRLAPRTRDLRDKLIWLLDQQDEQRTGRHGEDFAARARNAWKKFVDITSDDKDFADGVAQVVAYGMVIAALTTDVERDEDGLITVDAARSALKSNSPVMSAAFAPLLENAALRDAVEAEIGALENLVSAIDVDKVNRSGDRRGEPWLYFYEDFLADYDADERKKVGVYYTPTAVVEAIVRITDFLLVEKLDRRLGFADKSVITLDPATGTGTFPLAVIERGAAQARKVRGELAGGTMAADTLSRNLYALEILPGPYSVAHLRIGQKLRKLKPDFDNAPQVLLTDTLDCSSSGDPDSSLFGDIDVLAREQARAKVVKTNTPVTVVLGNPPYRRLEKDPTGRGGGSWIVSGKVDGRIGSRANKSLFDDMLDVAKQMTIFSHHASLYNLYVYFWRWAIWKVFEQRSPGPGIVAMITGNSWLKGPGFVGLRKLVRETCDDVWVIDLGGDNKGAVHDDNVFAIETPVAVVVMVRYGDTPSGDLARVHYRRVNGSREEKLAAMARIAASPTPLDGDWHMASSVETDSFLPPSGNAGWHEMPALTDLFPWQQPGCKFNRTWPIAPDSEVLRARWKVFVSSGEGERASLFQTASHGRSIETKVYNLPRLNELTSGAEPLPLVRYGYRSFDRQWVFSDPRLANLERPALWQSISQKQLFLTCPVTKELGSGPAMTVSCFLPDLHYFIGHSGGKDIFPLYRDSTCLIPNVTAGLVDVVRDLVGLDGAAPEDLVAYVYAVFSSPAYQEHFFEELKTPGPRVPLTREPALWAEAVSMGRSLLWLHTYAERFRDGTLGRGSVVPMVSGLEWIKPVNKLPDVLGDIFYDESCQTLRIGDGVISGVQKAVWEFTVSGMPVVKKWLGYRTAKGSGRAASSTNPLDKIRPRSWPDEWNDELLDLLRILTITVEQYPQQADLLDRICKGPLIKASELPLPQPWQTQAPDTELSASQKNVVKTGPLI